MYHGGGGNGERTAHSVNLPRALIIAEKEQLVLNDGPANCAAELLPARSWDESASEGIFRKLCEGIPSLISVRATEPEPASVNVIAARFSLGGNDAGHCLAEFRVIVLQRYFSFGHCVQIRINHDDSENRILIVGAVEFERSSAEVLALREYLLAALGILGCSVAPSHNLLRAWRQQLDLRDVLFVECHRDVGAIGLELRRFGRNFHGFAGRAYLELSVNPCSSVGTHVDVSHRELFKAWCLDLDRVNVRNEVRHRVIATLVGRGLVGSALPLIRDRNLRTGNGCALGIGNRTQNAAVNRLSKG